MLRAFGITDAPARPRTGIEIIDSIDPYESEVTIAWSANMSCSPYAYKSLRERSFMRHRQPRPRSHSVDRRRMFEHDEADIVAIWSRCTRSSSPAGSAARQRGQDRRRQIRGEREIPFFGICLGMQMACIEAARNQRASNGPQPQSSERPRSRSSASLPIVMSPEDCRTHWPTPTLA